MQTLGGIWDTDKSASMAFSSDGVSATCTISADCVAPCTKPDGTLTLLTSVPSGCRPSVARAGLALVIKQDVTFPNGCFYVHPSGYFIFIAPDGWAADSGATKSGVAAQSFSYLL
jgi:hypothetical protein